MENKTEQKEKFKPRPGQTDYTNIRWAPVMNCVLEHNGKILLVQRSKDLKFYPEYWSGVSGFLDDQKSLKQKVEEEIREEIGIPKTKIKKISLGEIFHQDEPKYKKTWIVHPILVRVETEKVKLDWEAKEHVWLTLKEARKMKLLPGFERVLNNITPLIQK